MVERRSAFFKSAPKKLALERSASRKFDSDRSMNEKSDEARKAPLKSALGKFPEAVKSQYTQKIPEKSDVFAPSAINFVIDSLRLPRGTPSFSLIFEKGS